MGTELNAEIRGDQIIAVGVLRHPVAPRVNMAPESYPIGEIEYFLGQPGRWPNEEKVSLYPPSMKLLQCPHAVEWRLHAIYYSERRNYRLFLRQFEPAPSGGASLS